MSADRHVLGGWVEVARGGHWEVKGLEGLMNETEGSSMTTVTLIYSYYAILYMNKHRYIFFTVCLFPFINALYV